MADGHLDDGVCGQGGAGHQIHSKGSIVCSVSGGWWSCQETQGNAEKSALLLHICKAVPVPDLK
jgi:hypothetical protein